MRWWALVSVATLFLGPTASAAVWYVDKDNTSGSENGLSWATAFSTIQPAIDAAYDDGGGEVWVAEGLYDELRQSPIDVYPYSEDEWLVDTGSLLMREQVDLYGGFEGIEAERALRDWGRQATVIDGSAARSGEAAYHVVVGADSAALDGFVITGGKADSQEFASLKTGGGMAIWGCSPTLTHCDFLNNTAKNAAGLAIADSSSQITYCRFAGNTADGYPGGAVSCGGFCTATISFCTFEDNTASSGGAIYSANASPDITISDCAFVGNQARYGAVLATFGGTLRFSRCVFQGNEAAAPEPYTGGSGGVAALRYSHTEFENCLFLGNSAEVDGGAVYGVGEYLSEGPAWTTSVYLTNCTFYGNTASNAGGALRLDEMEYDVRNCIFWNDTPDEIDLSGSSTGSVTYSLVEGGHTGEGNLSDPPLFVDEASGDFHLRTASPAVDTGTDEDAPDVDLDGIARPQGDGFDMGAYEYDGPPVFTLTLALEGQGDVEPAPGEYTYTENDVVTLEATPADGWQFDHWEGALTGSTNPAGLTITNDSTVIAVFTEFPTFTLTMAAHGLGDVTPPVGYHTYTQGDIVTLEATPADGWLFDHWEGDLTGSTNPVNLTITNDSTVTAVFTEFPTFTLTVAAHGLGDVTPPVGYHTYTQGDIVTLEATPADGWLFDQWEGDLTGSTNPTALTITADATVTAAFVEIPAFTLTVSVQGQGDVDPAPGEYTYTENDVVTLEATAAAGWLFDHWEGALTGSANPVDFTITSDAAVTAVFERICPLPYGCAGTAGMLHAAPRTSASADVLCLALMPLALLFLARRRRIASAYSNHRT